MTKYSNRRREHIHFIHQYEVNTQKYTGTRIVVYWKEQSKKEIMDLADFRIHQYENSKAKKHAESKWTIIESDVEGVIKKQMSNISLDGKYKMKHILYESYKRKLENYLHEVMEMEKETISNELNESKNLTK